MLVNGQIGSEKHGPFTLQQLQQLYHQQLLQQINDADAARNELSRVRAQLKVEMDARSEAQVTILYRKSILYGVQFGSTISMYLKSETDFLKKLKFYFQNKNNNFYLFVYFLYRNKCIVCWHRTVKC